MIVVENRWASKPRVGTKPQHLRCLLQRLKRTPVPLHTRIAVRPRLPPVAQGGEAGPLGGVGIGVDLAARLVPRCHVVPGKKRERGREGRERERKRERKRREVKQT